MKQNDIVEVVSGPLKGKIGKVTSNFFGSIFVKIKHARSDTEFNESELKIINESITAQDRRNLVKKFVKKEYLLTEQHYMKEIGFLKRLLVDYPELSFWDQLDFGFQVKSLCWFIGQTGKIQIRDKYALFKIDVGDSKTENQLSEEKFGEDYKAPQKKISLF